MIWIAETFQKGRSHRWGAVLENGFIVRSRIEQQWTSFDPETPEMFPHLLLNDPSCGMVESESCMLAELTVRL